MLTAGAGEALGTELAGCIGLLILAIPAARAAAAAAASLCGVLAGVGFKTVVTPPGGQKKGFSAAWTRRQYPKAC